MAKIYYCINHDDVTQKVLGKFSKYLRQPFPWSLCPNSFTGPLEIKWDLKIQFFPKSLNMMISGMIHKFPFGQQWSSWFQPKYYFRLRIEPIQFLKDSPVCNDEPQLQIMVMITGVFPSVYVSGLWRAVFI